MKDTELNRRSLLGGLATLATVATVGTGALAQGRSDGLDRWKNQIGLQLYTVRDRFPTDYAGTLKAVAAAGFREVQATISYGGHSLTEIKAYLDDAGLVSPATHVNPPSGAQFEPTLDAYARLGHRYTTVDTGPYLQKEPQPMETAKRLAAALNAAGAITKKHGLKVIVHNHTQEFQPFLDSPKCTYDILIAETDPSLVALELDIGWATAAGADVLELFRRAPGRFEVWHVKDFKGLAELKAMRPVDRLMPGMSKIVGLGEGEIDYRPIFAQAQRAGMKHFFIEQDTAPSTGDSVAAAAASNRYLRSIL